MKATSLDLARMALSQLDEKERAALLREGSVAPVSPGRALTIAEASRTAKVSRGLLYRALAAKTLKTVRLHPQANPRISEAALNAWLEGRELAS